MRGIRLLRVVVVALLAALTGASGLVVPAVHAAVRPAAAAGPVAPERVSVWQWNVAGDTLHHGSATDGLIEVAATSILRRSADLVSLNELCAQQFDALQQRLLAAGWPRDPGHFSAFQATVPAGGQRCGGQALGLALFSSAPIVSVDPVDLPSRGVDEPRALLCAAVDDRAHVRFCTTHITTKSTPDPRTGAPVNAEQLELVRHRLDAYRRAGETVVVAGDFNAQPDYRRLDDWYAPAADARGNPGNRGDYRELDDADPRHCPGYGEWTAAGAPGQPSPCSGGAACAAGSPRGCAKIDLILVPQDRIAGAYDADALDVPTTCRGVPAGPEGAYAAGSCSDHRVLVGTVALRARPPAPAGPGRRPQAPPGQTV